MTIKRSNGKIKAHYGMKDYYKAYYKSSENAVSYTQYSDIISKYNKSVIDLMLNNSMDYRVPIINFLFTIRKDKRSPVIKNGKLHNNRPIDFNKTMKLWNSDPEAKAKKIILRHANTHSSGYVYRIYCKKHESSVKNKNYYKYVASRYFKRSLSQRINDSDKDRFDCYLLFNKTKK
jgi:hypothetical protein